MAGTVSDLTAPVVQQAFVDPSKWAVDAKGSAEVQVSRRKKAKRGTTFHYSLSEAARVVFTIERASKGRKVGKKCRKQTKRNRTRGRCTRDSKVGSFAAQGAAGKNAKKFSGRIGRKLLRKGRHRAILVATDAAGNRSAARRVSFTVVRG